MKKIVVVDDDEQILEAVQIVLDNNGYEVVVVEDPTQAFSQIKAQQPSLVLLDLYIAGIDGRELIQQLRNDESLEQIPVVLMSADASLSQKADVANGILKKPFDISELEATVHRCLDKANG